MLEKEASKLEGADKIPENIAQAIASYRSRAAAAVESASTLIAGAQASASTVMAGAYSIVAKAWPSISGSSAAGSGAISTTDTIYNIPPQPRIPPPGLSSKVSEGHSSHNKQPRTASADQSTQQKNQLVS